MTKFLLNLALALIIGVGGLSLTSTTAAAATEPLFDAALIEECEDGWKLQCDGNVCCTTCQDNGEIGDCEKVD